MARLLLAILLSALQLGGVAHFALVRHEICWAHGEWLERGGHGSDVVRRATRPSVEPIASFQQESDGDEHCSLLARLRAGVQRSPALAQVQPEPSFIAPAQGPERPSPSWAFRYRLAPKQSPPLI